MDQFPPALAHNPIEEIFTDVFFVTGTMETVLMDADWKFSRNMTIVRDGENLTIVNSIRLDEDGLNELDKLGRVTDVIRTGTLHGRDDAFYVDRYNANYWALDGTPEKNNLSATHRLSSDAALPISNASVFSFETTKIPEAILHLEREGGILIACDALQNWLKPDEHFSDASVETMTQMGFFTPANIGPVWMQVAEPSSEDFTRLQMLNYKHVFCGHGAPLLNTAYADFNASFERIFAQG